MIYPATWSQVSQIRWQDMQLWKQPFAAPTGKWLTVYAAWGDTTTQLTDLSPGIGYDVQIRAVDKAGNIGAWSGTTTFVASADNIPPSTPAAPSVAASRIAVQVTHALGKSSGGTFNLESDLDHLEIHGQYEPTFTPDATTLLGKLKANAGMIQAQIAAVGTYNIESTSPVYVRVVGVDITGNRSGPSDAASATALLIDDAHISDLTVSKVTAGTINADFIVGARIKTSDTGSRVELNSGGIGAWNAAGTQTVAIAAADGSVSIVGQLKSGTSGKRIEINPTSTYLPEIRWYANTGTDYGYINAISSGTDISLGMNSSPWDDGTGTQVISRAYLSTITAELAVIRADDQTRRGGYVWAQPGGLFAGFSRGGVDGGQFYADTSQAIVDFPSGGKFIGASTQGWVGFDNGTSAANQITFSNSGVTSHSGRWDDYIDRGAAQGLFTGRLGFSGATSLAVSYGATRASITRMVCTVEDDVVHSDCLSANSTTGFTLTISPALNGAGAVYFWSFRV
jgi:hypothetical protein